MLGQDTEGFPRGFLEEVAYYGVSEQRRRTEAVDMADESDPRANSHGEPEDTGLTVDGVMQRIETFIGEESMDAPVSDTEIWHRLVDEGVEISRRTVAVLREMLAIPRAARRARSNKPFERNRPQPWGSMSLASWLQRRKVARVIGRLIRGVPPRTAPRRGARHYVREGATVNYFGPGPPPLEEGNTRVERRPAGRLISVERIDVEHVLLEGRTTVGGHEDNDIVLHDAKVSDTHCAFICRPTKTMCAVHDKGSTHGTLVNGEDIGIGEVANLESGDRITLGDTSFVLVLVEASEPG